MSNVACLHHCTLKTQCVDLFSGFQRHILTNENLLSSRRSNCVNVMDFGRALPEIPRFSWVDKKKTRIGNRETRTKLMTFVPPYNSIHGATQRLRATEPHVGVLKVSYFSVYGVDTHRKRSANRFRFEPLRK